VNEIPVRCEKVVNKPRPFATGMFLLAEQPYLPIKSPPVLFCAEIRYAVHHRYERIDPFAELLHPVGSRLAICLMSSGEAVRAKQLVLTVPTVLPTYPPAAAGAFSDGEQPALTEGGIDRRRGADLKLISAQPFVVDPRQAAVVARSDQIDFLSSALRTYRHGSEGYVVSMRQHKPNGRGCGCYTPSASKMALRRWRLLGRRHLRSSSKIFSAWLGRRGRDKDRPLKAFRWQLCQGSLPPLWGSR
jgi:hypothetical protein